MDRLGPDREVHLLEVAHVAHARVDDEATAAPCLGGGGEQVAEIAVGAGAGRGEQQYVAFLQLFDRDMDHPVVARRGGDRHRAAGDAGARIDGAHIGGEQALAALGFMDGGDARLGEAIDDGEVRPFDILDDNAGHQAFS